MPLLPIANDYPRPHLVRPDWLCLNGVWDFAFDDDNKGLTEKWYQGKELNRQITVPFCWESEAGGIASGYENHPVGWYSRTLTIPAGYAGKRLLLHFGAVDYEANVWVNGVPVGNHTGGYLPFALDITHAVTGGENRIVVRAQDSLQCSQPRGKQSWKEESFGCWYTPVSGIWQSVWLEPVEDIYIKQAHLTPDIDHDKVSVDLTLSSPLPGGEMKAAAYFEGRQVLLQTKGLTGSISQHMTLDLSELSMVDEIQYWSPETPNLYDLQLSLSNQGHEIDLVQAYFGMRKVDVKNGVFRLNNRPYTQKLILDQGYWKESLLTPPSGEALREDVRLTKALGYNGARKHQKIEDPRYYYWADKLGLLVWGEVPSGYEFCREEKENLISTLTGFIDRDYNHPCIVFWVPLNESWGVRKICTDTATQKFAESLYYLSKALDPTRLVSTNDGWEQVESDICAIHDYVAWAKDLHPRYQDLAALECANGGRMLYADNTAYRGQPVLITEYGGISYLKDAVGGNWGYNGGAETEADLIARFEDILRGFCALPYVQGYCYTQLTDVFQETNGLLDMDRKPKASLERICEINQSIQLKYDV